MNEDRYVLKSCKCCHSSTQKSGYLSLALYSWMASFATFENILVSIQMIRTLLFINGFLQVWYQNKEDIHLLHIMTFNLPNMKHDLWKWNFYKCPGTFFAECIIIPWTRPTMNMNPYWCFTCTPETCTVHTALNRKNEWYFWILVLVKGSGGGSVLILKICNEYECIILIIIIIIIIIKVTL